MKEVSALFYPVISAGPDWITATAKNGSASWDAELLAMRIFDEERAEHRDVTFGSRLGYAGHACAGFYFGRRPDGVLTIASGPRCAPLAQHIINTSTNVSRLDLQVTVDTSRDTPHLGQMHYRKLKASRTVDHRPGHLQLICGHPHGESFYLNKRSSDSMGRCYDKASESGIGPPLTIWRYEVEFKRRQARRYALALKHQQHPEDWTIHQILLWYTSKGLQPAVATGHKSDYWQPTKDSPGTDVLDWFDRSLSVTVAKSIRKYGLSLTLAALHLDKLVQPIERPRTEVQNGDKTFPPDA
jgi:hypothetical protein